MLTEEELVGLLKSMAELSNQKLTAKRLGISPQYLSDIIRCKRSPGSKVCSTIGVERVVMYRSLYLPEL